MKTDLCAFLRGCLYLCVIVSLTGCIVRHVDTSNATQYFPVGENSASAETGWRLSWEFIPHPQQVGEELLVLKNIDFMRGRKPDGSQEWIRVLDKLSVAGMFVPYVEGGSRFRDMYAYYTGLAQLDNSAATDRAYRPTYIHGDRIVRECTDDFVRWIETGDSYHGAARLRRGQAMTIWGMFSAYNYVYPMAFKFRDDGVLQVRIAASGQNLSQTIGPSKAHLHMGAWRLEPHLCVADNANCDSNSVVVQEVARSVVGGQEQITFGPLSIGNETGTQWQAEEFTALLLTNPDQPNGRPINCPAGGAESCFSGEPIGYAMIPVRSGSARFKANSSENFLDNEFWVTRKPTSPAPAELFYTELPQYVDGESLSGHDKVIWHKSAFNHIPRYEDMGFSSSGNGFDRDKGIALAKFTGFDLVPRNVMFSTPTYTPKPTSTAGMD